MQGVLSKPAQRSVRAFDGRPCGDIDSHMKDPWNPSLDEIRSWAYSSALIPDQDWELAVVDKPESQRLCLVLAADPACPHRQFFLGCLYVFTGDTISDKESHPLEELTDLLELAAPYSDVNIRAWVERSKALLLDPSGYTYAYWGLGSKYVYNY